MNMLSNLLPTYIPSHIKARGSIGVIRERILQTMLLGLSVLGSLAVAGAAVEEIRNGRPALAVVYAAILGVVIVCTIFRGLPYNQRAAIIPLLAYALAVTEFFDTSLLGEVRFWLLVCNLVTSLLFGFSGVLVSTAATVLTITVVGVGATHDWFILPHPENFLIGTGWVVSALTIALVSLGLGLGSNTLLNGLGTALRQGEKLVEDLNTERASLEERVEERTRDIQHRLVQVQTAAQISNAITHIGDPETLYQQVVELIQTRLDLYYAGLFLIDENRLYANLIAGTGEAGKTMLARDHRLQIGAGSMIGWCIANQKPRIALDVGEDAVRFNNPLLPKTRSELALPIISHGETVGALTIQSDLPEAFDAHDIVLLQGIADSLASAIENTRLLSELTQNLEEMRSLNRGYLSQAWSGVILEKGNQVYSYENPAASVSDTVPVEFPVVLRDQTIAHLNLEVGKNGLSEEELAYLDAISTQTALALENARLLQETERRMQREQKLNKMSARFSRAGDIEAILKAAVEELGQLSSVSEVSIELAPKDVDPIPQRNDHRNR